MKNFINKYRENFSKLPKEFWIFIAISSVFFIIYCLLSLVNHYNFRTNTFDLGIFNQALYQYSHFELGPNTLRHLSTLLGDHFELILLLLSPLYWVFGSYTLLIVQILSILFGGLGIYLTLERETKNHLIALGGSTLFYLFFGIFEALVFDYHNNVVGAMFIPWLFYFLAQRNFKFYYFFLFLLLISKENLPLIGCFLGISIILFEEKKVKKHGVITFFISLIYFFIVLKFIIPFFNGGKYDYWSYYAIGNSPLDAIKNILINPFHALSLLFDQETKLKMWGLILLSGGIFAVFKPKYSLLLLPIFAQKFFSDKPAYWGNFFQYSIEFAPIIPLAACLTIAQFKGLKKQYVTLALLLGANIFILSKIHFYDDTQLKKLFTSEHYFLPYRRESVIEALKMIPENASVSAQNSLVSHLTNRDRIFLFPIINESDYVIFNLNDKSVWPLKNLDELLQEKTIKIEEGGNYEKVYEKDNILLYKRKI